jgi:hypothetical protein
MRTHGIIQYNCGNANNENSRARPFFDSVDPKSFPILAIQEPMITEVNHTYIPRNFRPVRAPKYGQRVITMIHDKIPLVDWELKKATDVIEWTRVQLGEEWMNIINVYCRPGEANRERVHGWEDIERCLEVINEEGILLVGDFNCHHPAWGGKGVTREKSAEHLIAETEKRNLKLLNEEGIPTWRRGQRESTIDLGFASPGVASQVIKFQPQDDWTTMEDHIPIEIQLAKAAPRRKTSDRFLIKEAPWEAIAERVENSKWDEGEGEGILERLQDAITNALEDLCEKAKPSDWARPEWSKKAAEFLAGARKARRAYKKWNNPDDRAEWKRNRNALGHELRKNARTRWRKYIEEITQDSEGKNKHKGLWKMSKWSRRQKGQTEQYVIPPLRKSDQDQAEEANDKKAEILATKFFPKSGQADLSDINRDEEIPRFHIDSCVTETDLILVLKELPNGKAPGPDKIPNEALKQLRKKIAPGMAKAVSWIFKQGEIPIRFKESTTIVLRKDKKKDYSLPSSYRPIALENTIAKVIEKIIAGKIMTEAEKRGLIPWNQMGARKHRSTLSALELLSGSIQTAWKAKKAVVSVLGLDLAGAFDNVSHERLLWVLRKMGFPEWIVQMVRSFLSTRRTRIAFSDYTSKWFNTETGIPQGSTLSPALFIIFIADLLQLFEKVSGDVLGFGFVDDTTLITWGDSAKGNCRRLTLAHDKCVAWAKRFGAKFAPDKYQVIHFTKKKRITEDLKSTVTIQGHDAELVDSLRVLGVWLDPSLSWKDHISKAVSKGISAFESLARISTSVWGPSVRKTRLIYTAVVRPVMMYGSQVWSAKSGDEIASQHKLQPLAVVQNKCIRRIMGAYKRTPIAAIEREAEIPPLDLHVKSQNTQWAVWTSTTEVTDKINNALDQVWKAAKRKKTPVRGRRPKPAGPRPRTAVEDVRKESKEIVQKSRARIEHTSEAQRNKATKTMQKRSTSIEVDSHFAQIWQQRWNAEVAKRKNSNARVWHSPWTLQPLTLYEELPKHQATALFLLRTEVLGINYWLSKVIPGHSPACSCGPQPQSLGHLMTFCPRTTEARLKLIERTGSTDIRGMLDTQETAKHAARWLLDTRILAQFGVAVEVEEEEMGDWEALVGLHKVSA